MFVILVEINFMELLGVIDDENQVDDLVGCVDVVICLFEDGGPIAKSMVHLRKITVQ
jgi:hypothetical protein